MKFIIKQSDTNNIIFIDKDSGVKESIHFYPPSYVKSISMNGTDRVNFITRDIKDYFRLSIPEDVIKIISKKGKSLTIQDNTTIQEVISFLAENFYF